MGRGKPRLGRRLRRLPWPDRGPALPSPLQLAHRRGLDRGRRRRLRDGRWPRGRRAHVLRLPGPLRRRGLQPDGQVAVDERRPAQDASRPARVRGREVRCSALPGLERARRSHPGPEGLLPDDPDRRQGHAQPGTRRHRPGRVPREPEALRQGRGLRARRRARGLLRDRRRRAGDPPRGHRHHDRRLRRDRVQGPGGRGRPG